MITYVPRQKLPRCIVVELEKPTDEHWRVIVFEHDENGCMSVLDIIETETIAAAAKHAVQICPEEVWVRFKTDWYVHVKLTSNYVKTNTHYLTQMLQQAHATPKLVAPHLQEDAT